MREGDKVRHLKRNLRDGHVISVSPSGKTAVVTWGAEETEYGYMGTTYHTGNLVVEGRSPYVYGSKKGSSN